MISKLVLFTVLVTVFYLYVYFKRRFKFWKNKNVYTETPTVPFGNAKKIILHEESASTVFKNLHQECIKKHLPFQGFYFFTKPILVVADLDLIKAITKTDFDHFTDRVFHSSDTDPLSLHLAALRGSRWRIMRNKLAPVFTPSRIKLMYETIEKCALELVSELKRLSLHGERVEMKNMAARYSIDVLVNCAFGLDCKTVKNENMEFVAAAESFYSTSLKDAFLRSLSMFNPNLINILNIKSTKPDIEKLFMDYVSKTVKEREDNNIVRKDLMHTLLQIRNNVEIKDDELDTIKNANNTNISLSISDIAAQCFIFFIGGFETSSSTITFCLYELALNTNYQDQIRSEVLEMLKKHNGEFSYDFLMDLSFTQKCVKETLRKYPPLDILMRECTKEYKIPSTDVTVEEGTFVCISVSGVHHDPANYFDPETFDPNRFSEENSAERHPNSFLSFGYGTRNCIAYHLGYVETTLAIATLIYNFRVQLHPSTSVPLVMDTKTFVVRAKGGVFLNFEKVTG